MRPGAALGLLLALLVAAAPAAAAEDQRQLAAITLTNFSEPHVMRVFEPDGTVVRTVLSRQSNSGINSPSWSRDAQTIVYAEGGKLFKIPAAGGAEVPLGDGFLPSFSPVADEFAYWRTSTELRAMKADGSADRLIASGLTMGGQSQPSWAPDGTSVAVKADNALVRVDVATGAKTTILAQGAGEILLNPALSPDGTRVAFGRHFLDAAKTNQLIVRDLVSGAEKIAWQAPNTNVAFGSAPGTIWWSADSLKVAYAEREGPTPQRLVTVNSDGSGGRRVVVETGYVQGLTWDNAPSKPNYFIRHVEVAQAISPSLSTVASPDPRQPAPYPLVWVKPNAFGFPEPLVARKRTLVRVYVGDEQLATGAIQRTLDLRLTSSRGQVDVSQSVQVTAPGSPVGQTAKDGAINLWLEAPMTTNGTLDLHLVVNPDKPDEECQGCHPNGNAADLSGVLFEHAGLLALHPVPITVKTTPPTTPAFTYTQILEGMRPLLPVADSDYVLWPETPVEIDPTGLGVHTVGCVRLLTKVLATQILSTPAPFGGTQRWAGYATMPAGVNPGCGGLASPSGSSFVIVEPVTMTAAHELGHTLGLVHKLGLSDVWPPLPPVPLPYTGLGGVGYWQDGSAWGVHNGTTTSDLMTYSAPSWTSPLSWSAMFTRILEDSLAVPPPRAARQASARASRRLVSGVVRGEQTAIFESLVADASMPAANGPVAARVVARDARGKPVASAPVRGEPIMEGSDAAGSVPFVVALPPKAKARSLVVRAPGGKTLARLRASRRAPRGRLLGLPKRVAADAPVVVRWRASDRDRRDRLSVVASARRGRGAWQVLALGVARGSASVVPSALGAGGRLRVRVLVSDGFNTTRVVSRRVRVR